MIKKQHRKIIQRLAEETTILSNTGKVVTLLFLSLSASVHADYVSEVMADGPKAYYRFEESAGASTLVDSSGNGYHSTVISNVDFGATGAVGTAGMFSDAYIQLANFTLSPAVGDFSIEAIAWFESTTINRAIASQQNGGGTGRHLFYRSGSGPLKSFLGGEDSVSDFELVTDEWHHVVMTVDVNGGTDTVRLYIDGQLAGTNIVDAEPAHGDWILGAAKDYGSKMNGLLDEVAIYTQELGQVRILKHCEQLTPTPTHYVATNGASVWPYTNWLDAATNIQDAVDAAAEGNTVLVDKGTYTPGSQINVSKAIIVKSA